MIAVIVCFCAVGPILGIYFEFASIISGMMAFGGPRPHLTSLDRVIIFFVNYPFRGHMSSAFLNGLFWGFILSVCFAIAFSVIYVRFNPKADSRINARGVEIINNHDGDAA
ncbi:MAG TPA: hypothetical protein VGG19_16280 [Tepidisphaeraceae bacterium]|jgi:hypothetical protein